MSFGSISEHGEQWAIFKYGKGFSFTFELLVNDQLDLVMNALSAYGAAAARMESNLVWSIFKSNPTVFKLNQNGENVSTRHRWFSQGHKNIGSAESLSLKSLGDAKFAMSIQQGHDGHKGDRLNITPKYLIVPSRLELTAYKLLFGDYVPNYAKDVNVFHNRLNLISEGFLNPDDISDDAVFPWYLAADPQDMPSIWMAYLDGIREPRIKYNYDFLTQSTNIRADISMGVTHGDHRGVYMNPGVSWSKQLEENGGVA